MKPCLPRRRWSVLALSLLAAASCPAPSQSPAAAERARWQAQADRVTLTRDDWGIAHVHGKTDADAVFGMIYAQCEDDFNRVETNYLVSLGRLSEAEGEERVWQDLRQRLFVDPVELKRDYDASPAWLQRLMDAWADGLNFYLAQHPEVKPRVITHWEPWMALSFTEGSIGGDIEKVNLNALRQLYASNPDNHPQTDEWQWPGVGIVPRHAANHTREQPLESLLFPHADDPGGSNGVAIAPSNTVDHHALLLINPHTSFFFRSELQMSSDEGLEAYGAVTWGQFFVYQGFNSRAGWMHTSSNVDAIDEYLETLQFDSHTGRMQPPPQDGVLQHDDFIDVPTGPRFERVMDKGIVLQVKTAKGMATRRFVATYTQHGPVVRLEGKRWVTIRLMNLPVKALEQSFLRTKARSYAEYRKTMEIDANSSNNTIFADADGNIAYWHGDYIPIRDTRFDFTHPVDGSDPATDWKGLMTVDQIPHLKNPASGFLFNVNNAPWWGAGVSSLRKSDFPAYVEQGGETARGRHAIQVLDRQKGFTLDNLLTRVAYDPYLPWFASTVPALLKAYDALPAGAPQRQRLAEPIAALRGWDLRWAANSVPTSLAVYWGEALQTAERARRVGSADVVNGRGSGGGLAAEVRASGLTEEEFLAVNAGASSMLAALDAAVQKLTSDFGTWKTAWGEINRFQRLNDQITPRFTDAGPSIPVPFTASTWGSLASFAARAYPGTKKRYGSSGNSFVAVVEFGPRVRARAVTCGGESGDPASLHFNDEAQRYTSGDLRDVYFYPDELKKHTAREYHPGR